MEVKRFSRPTCLIDIKQYIGPRCQTRFLLSAVPGYEIHSRSSVFWRLYSYDDFISSQSPFFLGVFPRNIKYIIEYII